MTRPSLAISSLLIVLLSLSSGCSFVETIPGANQIIIANDEESCTKVGQTTVKVLHRFLWMDRDVETVSDELQTLAQNSAVKMRANAIWPVSPVKEGSRTYHIYRCKTLD